MKYVKQYAIIFLFAVFALITYLLKLELGFGIMRNFKMFFMEMMLFLPVIFIFIGLFDVWFPKEKIEKHIGEESGFRGLLFVVLLSMIQAGPLYGAFPVTYVLWKKGCSARNVFIYLGSFATLKIPMMTFEIGYLGWKFSLMRNLLNIPFFIIIAVIMSNYVKNKNFEVLGNGKQQIEEHTIISR